ncbi:hypothetical protein TNCV_1842481 [Trichonephila clavipes]|nr:hypothetical protein TNCV_1842481 [Trichonephila clavipes]
MVSGCPRNIKSFLFYLLWCISLGFVRLPMEERLTRNLVTATKTKQWNKLDISSTLCASLSPIPPDGTPSRFKEISSGFSLI